MKFKYKLLLGPAFAALFLLLILGLSNWVSRRNEALLSNIETGYVPAVALSRDLDRLLSRLQRELQDAVAAEDEELLGQASRLPHEFEARLDSERYNPVIPSERREALRRQFVAYASHALSTSRRLMRREPAAMDALPEMTQRYNATRQLLEELVRSEQRALTDAFAEARALHHSSRRTMWLMGALCVVLLGVLSLWFAAQLSRPLTHLTALAARIATQKDLTVRVEVRSRDEVGRLAESFAQMVEQLRTMALSLRSVVDELAGTIRSLTRLTSHQSEALERQARSLTEASATIQEIYQTSTVAAGKAEGVLSVAVQAEKAGTQGQHSLELSIQELQALSAEVNALVGSISGLTGQTSQAGDIIQRVKGMADQSHMLALNAAIEASRAGEAGKSFAVVAREIRLLADQSLRSTNHIREILADLQGSIGNTVRNTEHSSQRMEAGITQVRKLGEQLRELTHVVQESSRAAQQIVASVGQQNAGITQMTSVINDQQKMMQELHEATTEGHQGVERLNLSFQRLQEVVGGFRV
ncbi:MAG TPA: methyl-accepting chemotaxis protein [Myxococcaceae bacterium]|nr:methyl-accepting chemotaxis protein [Myxococcaceae bacterium]